MLPAFGTSISPISPFPASLQLELQHDGPGYYKEGKDGADQPSGTLAKQKFASTVFNGGCNGDYKWRTSCWADIVVAIID